LLKDNDRIDLFLAGDSVMQGVGVPGILEFVKDRIPVTMWSVSMAGYGPRQKVNASIAHALPKKPRWLIVEFFSGNDVTDAIEAEVADGAGKFRRVMNKHRVRRRLLSNPVYASMLSAPADRFDVFEDYVEDSLTVAASRYYIDRLKSFLRSSATAPDRAEDRISAQPPSISVPATTSYVLEPGQRLHWAQAGMSETHKHYRRLVAKITELETKPVVILLYNPAGYEIYRDILVDRQPEYDRVSEFQIEAQKAFAEANGWRFMDLTPPLRTKLEKNKVWIYGQNDSTHWSHHGTAFVAETMAEELVKVMAQ
jgi:lysophospholipase L1-like esterase